MQAACRTWKLALAALVSGVSITCSAMPANFQEMQTLLNKQVDLEQSDRFSVIPVYPDEAARALAHAVLDELGKQDAYREDMDRWLADNRAPNQEELVKAWFRHYHKVIQSDSFEFLAPDDVALLWKVADTNPLYALKRTECQGLSAQQINDVVSRERARLIAENKQKIAAVFARAVAKELQREQHPQAGDRRPADVHQMLVMQSFQKMKSLWPKDDQAILQDAFAYHPTPPQRTPAEDCERNWLVSHAIGESASQGVPFLLESVTMAQYAKQFANVDRPFAMSRPTLYGFVPGKVSVHYPELALRKNVQGKTMARISIDAAGNATDVKIVDDTLVPASITSGDGRVYTSKDLFAEMLENYFKAGKFPAQQDQAKPSPFDIEFVWRLHD
jgi:hypothetical protein